MLGQTIFSMIVILIGALATATCAVLYFRNVRLERPAIGVFNGRDIVILLFFIVSLPFLYVILPEIVLIGFLILTFSSALYIGLRPLIRPLYLWPLIIFLLGINIVVTEFFLGTLASLQVYWILTSTVVLLSAMGISNLYVQGGMRLRHIAWFALILAGYDLFFTTVIPLIQKLADKFAGHPLDASIGFATEYYNANIGIGDLLVYSLFIVAAYKGFGRKGLIASFVIIPIFGAILPSIAPMVLTYFIRNDVGIVVPAQLFFGPAAFVTYWLLSRHTPERSLAEWYSLQSASGRPLARTQRRRVRVTVQPSVGGR